jgi:transposase
MTITMLGIDLGKTLCSVVGLDAGGAVVLRRRLRGSSLAAFVAKLPACASGMEVCWVLTTLAASLATWVILSG